MVAVLHHGMNNGIRALWIGSGLFCALVLAALAWLATRATEPENKPAAVRTASAWDKPTPLPLVGGRAPGRAAAEAPLEQLQQVALQMDELTRKLRDLLQAKSAVPGELLLTFKTPADLAAFRERAAAAGIELLAEDPRLLAVRVRYSDAEAMARELQAAGRGLDNVGLNYYAWVPALPRLPETDTSNAGGSVPFGNSGLDAIGATGNRGLWGLGVTVAVLDTGITNHSSLAHSQVMHYDLVKDGQEFNGHGTAMASLIAGNDPENGGVAVASRILDIRVADVNGESNTALVAQGIMQAVDLGAKVINISLGSNGDSVMLHNAILYAQQKGVVVVAAAGNDQQTSLAYPAAYSDVVISVGAVDATNTQAYFSNSGDNLTLAAPGVGIVSAYSGDRTVVSSGTSQATALTSGVVATLLSRGESAGDVRAILTSAATATGAPKAQVGSGVLRMP